MGCTAGPLRYRPASFPSLSGLCNGRDKVMRESPQVDLVQGPVVPMGTQQGVPTDS